MTKTNNLTPVIETLTKIAVHTLNVYGDSDPTGCEILYGLTRMAEMIQGKITEPDESVLDNFYKAIADTKASQAPADVPPISDNEMRHTQTVLKYFIEKLTPEETDLEKMKAALEYLTDFYAASNEAVN